MSNTTAAMNQSTHQRARNGAAAPTLLALLLTALLLAPAASAAEPPPPLWKGCLGGFGSSGGAGECNLPRGIATSAAPGHLGHLYVVDQSNQRVDELTAWGQFVRAWGWGVRDGSPELQICTAATGCQRGLAGSGAGQFQSSSAGVAVDSAGNVYVVDRGLPSNARVQKFDPEGHFLRMWGGDVIRDGAAGTATVSSGSATVTSVITTEKVFRVGQPIAGTGIGPGTTIAAVGKGTITLSQPAGPAATGTTTALSVPAGPNNVPANERQTVKLGANTTGGTFALTFETPDPSPTTATAVSIPATATALELEEELKKLSNIGIGNVEVEGPAGGPWTVEFSGARYADTNVEQISANASGLTVSSGEKTVTVTSANPGEICTIAAECQAGAEGTANGQFGNWGFASFIAAGPADAIYLGDTERIQKFDSDGSYQSKLEGDPLAGKTVKSLAVDPSGNLYVAFNDPNSFFGAPLTPNVIKLSPGGATLCTAKVAAPTALATDSAGNLYVADGRKDKSAGKEMMLREFGPSCAEVPGFAFGGGDLEVTTGIATGEACFSAGVGFYVSNLEGLNSFLRGFGPPPDDPECPPPPAAPSIDDQYAASVGTGEATLRAQINPHFWSGNVGQTTYAVQYATAACIEGSGWEAECVKEQPTPPAKLISGVVNVDVTTAGVFLSGLLPETRYEYRFLAENDSPPPGGQPVIGKEAAFTTFPSPGGPQGGCANQAFRTGSSAHLPDCRAYEMVSPLDKAGGAITTGRNARLNQAAPDGRAITYSAKSAFGGALSAPLTSQYIATRRPGEGWASEPISPPQEGEAFNFALSAFSAPYEAFNADLSEAWLQTSFEPLLAPGAVAGYDNLYRRDNASGSYEACTTSEPRFRPPFDYGPAIEGIAADGSGRAVFMELDQLAPGAVSFPLERSFSAPFTNPQLYECGGPPSGARQRLAVSASGGSFRLAVPGEGGGGRNEVQVVSLHHISGAGFTLTATVGTGKGTITAGSNTITGVTSTFGAFHVGDTLSAPGGGFSSGTATVTEVKPGELVLSNAAIVSRSSTLWVTETTAPIANGASAATMGAALEALAGIGAGNLAVSGKAGGPWWIEFSGALANTDVPRLGGDGEAAEAIGVEALSEISPPLPAGASAGEVQAALEGLEPIGGGNVAVSESSPGVFPIAFGGAQAGTVVPQIIPDDSALSGGSPSAAATVAVIDPGGRLRLVSVLPDGAASEEWNTVGTGSINNLRSGGFTLAGAVSADASRIYWSAAASIVLGPAPLYLRLNSTAPESERLHGAARGRGDLIGPATGVGKTTINQFTVTGVETKSGAFALGQQITDSNKGIPAGTTITAIEAEGEGKLKLTLSAKASKGKTGDELIGAASPVLSNITTESGAFALGQEISGNGIPAATTVAALAPGSLTLSAPATETKAGVALSATSDCTEAETKACTLAVSEGNQARFWAAKPDGSQALYSGGNGLYLFDLEKALAKEAGTRTLIATGFEGVLGQSEDLSHIYFLSEAQIGGNGTSGQPNLYLYRAGEGGGEPTFAFIATLAAADLASTSSIRPAPADPRPAFHSARVSPDGSHLAFMSASNTLSKSVAEYDNTDTKSPAPCGAKGGICDAEIYTFEEASGELACVSCNPGGARPAGRELNQSGLYAPALLPTWETSLYGTNPLADDGGRLFFEAFEPLVLADTNGATDVYEWEAATGKAECKKLGAQLYVAAAAGCLSLISTGKSPDDSEFIDATPDGESVFFNTAQSLIPVDPGSVDLYVARLGGGLPLPPSPLASCEGEACQSPLEAPNDPTPASATYKGAGSGDGQAAKRKPCSKGKVRRHGKCLRRHKAKHERHRRSQRRAGSERGARG